MTTSVPGKSPGKSPLIKRPAVLVSVVLMLVVVSWDKVELSRSLRRRYHPRKTAIAIDNNGSVSRPQRIAANNNISDATISSSSSTVRNATISSSSSSSPAAVEARSNNSQTKPGVASPACRPHFQLALPDGNWTSSTKFKRLYFYHTRKAGGTNLRHYFKKVAAHHGLTFDVSEYIEAEDPGTRDEATFYVTNLREPVARSISHFKYEGRWDCKQLVSNTTFIPTEENAQELSAWNQQFGFHAPVCRYKKDGTANFKMTLCAVNCYVQWFAGLSCPWWDPPETLGPDARPIRREVPMARQREAARRKLRRYNLIVITDMLRDADYVAAVERFLGVPGLANRVTSPWCEVESHYANERMPLMIHNETLKKLTSLNKVDIRLYHEMKDCLGGGGGEYDFPTLDPERFERNETIQIDHSEFICSRCYNPKRPPKEFLKRFNNTQ